MTISEQPWGPFELGSFLFDPLIRLRNRSSLDRLAELVEQASQPVETKP